METNPKSSIPNIIPFKRKKWCIFCTIFSIPFKPGIYFGATRSQNISLTSNNPNEIFLEMKRNKPSPLIRALNTNGLKLNEAIAWRRIIKTDLHTEFETLQQGKYEKIVLPESVVKLLNFSETEPADETVTIGKKSATNPNSFLGALLFRLNTLIKFFFGYSIPLLVPFAIIKPQLILPVLSVFGANLFLAALTWPFVHLKSWIKGILLAIFSGVIYSLITYFFVPQYFQPGLSIAAVITGLLIGFLLDCTDREG